MTTECSRNKKKCKSDKTRSVTQAIGQKRNSTCIAKDYFDDDYIHSEGEKMKNEDNNYNASLIIITVLS